MKTQSKPGVHRGWICDGECVPCRPPNIRNPILASYVAKGILPYHGIGSGIKRALEDWPEISFADDRDGCLFTATVHRKEVKSSLKSSLKGSGKTDVKILHMLSGNPHMTIPEMAVSLGITTRGVRKQIATLKKQGRLRRIGPDKGGHWQVIDKNET